MSTIPDKIHNLLAPITGAEKIGFIDTSKDSLYSKHTKLGPIMNSTRSGAYAYLIQFVLLL